MDEALELHEESLRAGKGQGNTIDWFDRPYTGSLLEASLVMVELYHYENGSAGLWVVPIKLRHVRPLDFVLLGSRGDCDGLFGRLMEHASLSDEDIEDLGLTFEEVPEMYHNDRD